MDKVGKALKKLNEKERKAVKEVLENLEAGTVEGLDIKKLKGRTDIFRVRKGDIRITYRKDDADSIFILAIERRSEKTYKGY